MTTISESTVEQAWLEGLSWHVAHGPDIAPDTPGAERSDYAVRLQDTTANHLTTSTRYTGMEPLHAALSATVNGRILWPAGPTAPER